MRKVFIGSFISIIVMLLTLMLVSESGAPPLPPGTSPFILLYQDSLTWKGGMYIPRLRVGKWQGGAVPDSSKNSRHADTSEGAARAIYALTVHDSAYDSMNIRNAAIITMRLDTLRKNLGSRIVVVDTTEFLKPIIVETTGVYNHSIVVTGTITGDSLKGKGNKITGCRPRFSFEFVPGNGYYDGRNDSNIVYVILDSGVNITRPGWVFNDSTNSSIKFNNLRVPIDGDTSVDSLRLWWCANPFTRPATDTVLYVQFATQFLRDSTKWDVALDTLPSFAVTYKWQRDTSATMYKSYPMSSFTCHPNDVMVLSMTRRARLATDKLVGDLYMYRFWGELPRR